ncbi:hypothetical protein [Hellea balneolensis]|uniref:hypothetical protein n=1 Tax=Hellea balneolensis TaxID=287478 RepID=UPI0003FE713E|nr:hypothetical protein [Hellea balneolensis]
MIIWVRNIVLILFVLTIIYLAMSTVSRLRKRQRLKLDYTTAKTETPEDEFIANGMQKYERSLKPKLFIGVYLFPLAVILLLGYLAQYS